MALYLVSYDIAEKNPEDYQPLWDALETSGARRVLYSQWVLPSSSLSGDVFEQIRELLHEGDGLLVQEITSGVTWQNLRISDADFKVLARNLRV